MKHEIININGFGNCLKLSNDKIEVITTLDCGPRIIGFNFIGKKNFLNPIGKVNPIECEWGDFYTYGGHRLWHAPEVKPRSYVPDNDPIKYKLTDTGAIFYYNFEKQTCIAKKFELILNGASINVKHTITNENVWDIELAPWALTIVAPGGTLYIPQEPFQKNTKNLLPVRPVVLWSYTDMADKRFDFGTKFIKVKNIKECEEPTKIGVLNTLGWVAYTLDDTTFVKSFEYVKNAKYVDFGCNVETFTQREFHEIETVAPLCKLAPKTSVDYVEKWSLLNDKFVDDNDIYKKINQYINNK